MSEWNPVGWFEIYVQDIDKAHAFYESVLGTTLSDLPMDDGEGLKLKMFGQMQDESESRPGSNGALCYMPGMPSGGNSTIVYFVYDDCAVEESRVEAAGGSIFKSKMSIGPYGLISLVNDLDGNMIGLHSMK